LPAILGAQLLQLPRLINLSSDQTPILLIGFFAAFISGSLALKLLKKLVIKGQLSVFASYCLILAGLVLARLFLS
jgi:undecaprenyl-diphosphatase